MAKNPYKATLNLPQTAFPMKANLVQREPEFRRRWDEMDLYGLIRAADHPKGRYVLHDGPPYANGDIHIGTGINKILKDLVVKVKTMQGYDAPFIPGWDCHGQPIEHKVRQQLGPEKADALPPEAIRARCEQYALKYVKKQAEQFRMLGVLGRWEKPYLTLKPGYEQREMETLAALADEGLLYREKRAIHWCASCHTALAEAELEYADDAGPSIYVRFPLAESNRPAALPDGPLDLLIWTTTPWTLPANMAVAVHPSFQYAAVRVTKGGAAHTVLVAADLVETVTAAAGLENVEVLATVPGEALDGLTYAHSFMGPPPGAEARRVIADATMVTLEEGTGLVHSAPGHGREDNLMGVRARLAIYSPVDEGGRLDDTVPEWIRGMGVFEANPVIMRHLEGSGHLVHGSTDHVHRYPHCWRCREPVIFRATEQWFVSLDKADEGKSLRERALEAVGGVQWVPAAGEARIRAMIETRPDWCVSRQKVWDVPIPALYCEGCGRAHLTGDMMRQVGAVFGKEGSNAWYTKPVDALFDPVPVCPDCGGAAWGKETDVFDVWLDSGVSWAAVCEAEDLGMPVELYFEGSDQHRGWFQSSLIMGVVARGQPPYRTCITHGWVMDADGRKMSKSLGNVVSVLDEVNRLGADVVRLWASSIDYTADIRCSDELITKLQDAYRKIRNTLRFMLGNLADFEAARDALAPDALEPLDRWLRARTARLVADVTAAMDDFQFHRAGQLVHVFCVSDLSAFYLDVQKDVLYCDAPGSARRRSCQTAMAEVVDVLVRLLAPVLVHTAEEAWQHLPAPAAGEREPSVHLARWPQADEAMRDDHLLAWGEWLQAVRRDAYVLIEAFRRQERIHQAIEARVALVVTDAEELARLKAVGPEALARLLIVSELVLVGPEEAASLEGEWAEADEVERFAAAILLDQPHARCERCWNYRPTVGEGEAAVCARCRAALDARDTPPDGPAA